MILSESARNSRIRLLSSLLVQSTLLQSLAAIYLTSIKEADFFASLAFDAQKPEELAVEVVVHLGAARTSPCTKTPVGQSFSYTFPDVRLERRFHFGNAAVNEFNVLRIVRSQHSFSCSRVRWYVALYDATHISLLRSPAIQPRQRPFPVVVLETEVLEFQVSILRQTVGILSGEFRFLVFHFSLTPFDKFQVCSRDILIYQMVTMEMDSCVMNLLMPRQKKRDTRSLLRLSSCNRHIRALGVCLCLWCHLGVKQRISLK